MGREYSGTRSKSASIRQASAEHMLTMHRCLKRMASSETRRRALPGTTGDSDGKTGEDTVFGIDDDVVEEQSARLGVGGSCSAANMCIMFELV
jgi:hypothetical protein